MRFILAFLFAAITLLTAAAQDHRFFVATNGNDHWSGTLPAPNGTKSDGPLATPAGARDALRRLRHTGQITGSVTVEIRGGTYPFGGSLQLTAEDSGTTASPVVWRAYENERVVFSGGIPIRKFTPVRDPAILARVNPEARPHLLATDLRTQGVTEYGEITPKGGPPLELFVNGKRMIVARFPNKGWLRIADVPQTGDTMYNKGLEREKRYNGVPAGRHYGRITYDGNEPSRWAPANDIFLHGYWTFDWSDSYQRVQSIDTVKHEITLRPPHHWYGYTKNQRYYVMNVLEELDSPGEWYLDRAHGLLYVWPQEEIREAVVSMLREPIVTLNGCSNTRIEGISFLYTRGRGVSITGGHDNLVARCVFAEMGGDAVWVDGGFRHGVVSCDMYDLGLGAIFLRGGDRKTLAPGGHYAEDNDIHDYSTWLRTGQYAVIFEGVGHRMSHNLIYNSPFEGVTFRGNDMLIEYNEFHDLMKETGDAGAIHVGRDWTWQGNVIRYNYFHDLQGPGLHGVMGVYLDDWASGFTVTGNLFYRAGRATMIGGGRFNTVTENIYVECSPSLHVDARGLGWASYYFDGTTNELFAEMDSMHYTQPPYSTRYPGLLKMEDSTPGVPKYNVIERNISYGGRWMDVYDYLAFDLSVVTIKDNVIGDPVLLRRRKDGEKGWDPYYLDIDMKEGYVALPNGDPGAAMTFRGNTIVNGNPGVRNPARRDFSLVPGSAAARLGFTPVPAGMMGLQRH